MTTKVTLDELGEMVAHVVKHMATKEDIERLDNKIDNLQIQVNSIEQHLRSTKADIRLADLEERVFGTARI